VIRGFVAGVVVSVAVYWFWTDIENLWRDHGGYNFIGPEAQ
jgi:hypothetical protein